MTNQIGKKIKYLRDELNMNQSTFANYIDVTQASLSTYENGNRLPSLDVLIRIADKCNVTLDWLCSRDNARHFMTVADIIMALKEFKELNGFEENNLTINAVDLAVYTSYECTITLNSDVHKLLDENNTTLGHILEFINDWKETTEDLSNLKNKDIIENYKQMWWEKKIAYYSKIPVEKKDKTGQEILDKILSTSPSKINLGEE